MKRLFIAAVLCLTMALGVYYYTSAASSNPPAPPSPSPTKATEKQKISALVVPHYDGAKAKRQALIEKVARTTAVSRIVLVSVNHYNVGRADIITTTKSWQFAEGEPAIDHALIDQLVKSGVASTDDSPFLNEHGIAIVFPDLLHYFPHAQFMPLIIKDTTPRASVDALLLALQKYCTDCLLVDSIDFSHYNPDTLAAMHDEMSLGALAESNSDKAWAAETDSPQGLYLTTKWAQQASTAYFHLDTHSNSGADVKDQDLETVSYILGYYSDQSSGAYQHPKTTTFLVGGDLMFGRSVNHLYKDTGFEHIFDNLSKRVFWGSDLGLANLEGPISDTPVPDIVEPNNLVFHFAPESVKALQFMRVNAVSHGNNHSLNAGPAGLATSKRLVEDAGIAVIGQEDVFNDHSVKRFAADIPLTVIAVNMLRNPSIPDIAMVVQKEHEAGQFVLMFPHWGVEYQAKHSAAQSAASHAWIEAGADAIIGAHPHVIQDFEVYQGKPIVYSVGNFVFDQTFSAETETGLLVGGVITAKQLTISFFPIHISNTYQPKLLRGAAKQAVVDKLINVDNSKEYETVSNRTIQLLRH